MLTSRVGAGSGSSRVSSTGGVRTAIGRRQFPPFRSCGGLQREWSLGGDSPLLLLPGFPGPEPSEARGTLPALPAGPPQPVLVAN